MVKNSLYKNYLNKKRLLLLVTTLLAFILLNSLLVVSLQVLQIKKQLTQKVDIIKKDIKIKNETWDLSLYNRDPQLIGNYPLYFFTSEGFVLDRRSPIRGFLDTSDFKRLLLYEKPQTVETITNQTRRIVSKPILKNGKPIAVIAVSYYEPSEETLSEIDKKLFKNLVYIQSKIQLNKDGISLKNLDERYLDFNVSYVIVDSYNNILKKTNNINSINRIPNFIDPSYIKPFISRDKIHFISSPKKEYFLLVSQPFLNKDGSPAGVIIVGQSLHPIFSILPGFILGQSLLLIIFFLLVSVFIIKMTKTSKHNMLTNQIIFNEKKGVLIIGKKEIEIPYATNQYYLVQALFTYPKKRFETDELLKRFGEDTERNNRRKVYDTMIKVNKKVILVYPDKLIINQNKTYQLNPAIQAIKQST